MAIQTSNSIAAPPEPARRRPRAVALLAAMRPRQWTRNLLLLAALLFTIDQRHSLADFGRCFAALAIFCVLSGATYLVNDVLDAETDRLHPTKMRRPVASGEISSRAALAAAALLFACALAASVPLGVRFCIAALLYVAVTIAYSVRLKHVVLLDLLVLASGFVIRAIAGAWVIDVRISAWLILCTLLLALFLGISKRRSELVAVMAGRKSGRPVIMDYSPELLDQMSTIVTSALLMSYTLYTIESTTAKQHRYMLGTVVFVLYGIFRYLYLVHQRHQGESPDEALVKDRPLIACVVLWAATVASLIILRV